jgi:hypothetical protein
MPQTAREGRPSKMKREIIVGIALLVLASGCATDPYTRYGFHNADTWGIGGPGIIGGHTLVCADSVSATSASSPDKEYVTATGRVLLKPHPEVAMLSDAQRPIITMIRCHEAVCVKGSTVWQCTGRIRIHHPDGSFQNLEADQMWFQVKGSYFTVVSVTEK